MQCCSISTLACLALLLGASPTVLAQESEPAPDRGVQWGWQAGVVRYGTGDELNCPTGGGITLGAEARARRPWIGAVGIDLFLAGPRACTSIGRTTLYRGERVDVDSGEELVGAPRLRARLGRTVRIARLRLEPSFGVGVMYRTFDFAGAGARLLTGWVGGSVAVHDRDFPVGVEVEYGAHQVPFGYFRYAEGWEAVHTFRRWRSFLRLSLAW